MATNLKRTHPVFPVVVTHPTAPDSGDPVRFGKLCGVALTDEGGGGNAATETTVDFRQQVWTLTVDDNEGTGIAPGAILYYHDTGTGTPATSVNNTATSADAVFGIALGTLGANATGEIDVLLRGVS